MNKKIYILLGLCVVLILVLLKPWNRTDSTIKNQPDATKRHKQVRNTKRRSPKSRVAKYLATVRGKRGILIDSKLYLLGNLKDPAIVEPLLQGLKDKDPMARVFAAYALGQTKDPRAIEPLLKVLERRKVKDYASVYAAEALGNFNDPRIIKPLISALNDPYYEVRGFAPSSLGKMKVKKAEALLIKKLDDPHHFVRQQAALGLEAMKANSQVESLIRALKKETYPNNIENLVYQLGKTGDPAAVQPLIEALRTSPIPQVRVNAAIALSDIKDSSAITPMAQAMKLEKDPHVKSWISSSLHHLKEDREYGKLQFLNGKPVPKIHFSPAPQHKKQTITNNGDMLHISTAYNLWQRIDKNGFLHLVMPFSRAVAVEDCGDFVFVLHTRHCEVLCKAEQRWQVFTYSDGYPLLDYKYKVENYKNHVIFQNKNDTKMPLLHFDKTTRRFATLPVQEYNRRQNQWERKEVDEPKRQWMLKKHAIMKQEPGTSRESPVTLPNNHVKEIVSCGGKLFVSSGVSIRVFEQGKETQFLNAQNLLYKNDIKTMRTDGPYLLVLYKDNIDIFDTRGEIKLIKRFAFPELCKNWSLSRPAIAFNSKGLFYGQGRQFIVEEPGTRKKLYEAMFNVPISGVLLYQSLVLIQTSIGYSVFDSETMKIQHFYMNKVQKNEPYENEFEYYGLEHIGIIKDYYYYIESLNLNPRRLAYLNLKTRKIEYSNALPITPILTKFKDLQLKIHIAKEFLLTKYYSGGPLNSFNIYPLGESFKPLLMTSLNQNIAVPGRKPRGSSIVAFCPEENNLWMATNFALYSFDLNSKQWKNHFTGRNLFYYIEDLAVTEEGIYAFGSNSGSSPLTQWCRVHRETFQSESISNEGIMAEMHSIRCLGNRLIYASKNGVGLYDPKTQTDQVLATPNPINLAAVYGDKYLGVNQHYLYILEENGKVQEKLSLKELGDHPLDLEIIGNEIRIVTNDYLLRVNMKTREQIRVPLSLASHPVKIVTGNSMIPLIIFQRDEIKGYRLEPKGGMIFNYSGPFYSNNRIRVILEQGDTVYIGAEKGLYRLKKNNWLLEEAWFKPGSIDAITVSDDYYFLAAEGGIYQINPTTMENFFKGIDSGIASSKNDEK